MDRRTVYVAFCLKVIGQKTGLSKISGKDGAVAKSVHLTVTKADFVVIVEGAHIAFQRKLHCKVQC